MGFCLAGLCELNTCLLYSVFMEFQELGPNGHDIGHNICPYSPMFGGVASTGKPLRALVGHSLRGSNPTPSGSFGLT